MTTGAILFYAGVVLMVLTIILTIVFLVKRPKYNPEGVSGAEAGQTERFRSGYPTDPLTKNASGQGVQPGRVEPPTPSGSGTVPLEKGTTPLNQGTAPLEKGTMPLNQGTTPLEKGTMPLNQGTAPLEKGTMPLNQGTTPLVEKGTTPPNQGTTPLAQGTTPLGR